MQSDNKIEKAPKDSQAHEDRVDALSRVEWLPGGLFRAIGPIGLTVLVAGGAVGYYAFHYVTRDSVRFPFWISFMFSFLAFVVLLVQSVIYAQQAEFMKQQSQAMKQSVDRTDTIIENMRGQLDAMRDEAEAAKTSAKAAQVSAIAAQESASAAEEGVEVARDSMIYAQRAYVMVASGMVQIVDGTGGCFLKIINYGNTPASNVRVFGVAELRNSPPLAIDMRNAKWAILGVMPPKGEIQRVLPLKRDISPTEKGLMETGELQLYVWGAIEYTDVFAVSNFHQTKFSYFLPFPKSRNISPCATNNEAF